MNDFIELKGIGVLKVDKIFFESYYPILFTCKNEKNDNFICVCCQADSNIKKWLVTNILPETIVKLLSDKITIRDSFLKDSIDKYTIIYDNNKRTYEIEKDNDIDWNAENSIDLPTPGEFMDVEDDEFDEEMEYFRGMIIHYDSYKEHKNIKSQKNTINYGKDNVDMYDYYKECISISVGNLMNHESFKIINKIKNSRIPIQRVDEFRGKYKDPSRFSDKPVIYNTLDNSVGDCDYSEAKFIA